MSFPRVCLHQGESTCICINTVLLMTDLCFLFKLCELQMLLQSLQKSTGKVGSQSPMTVPTCTSYPTNWNTYYRCDSALIVRHDSVHTNYLGKLLLITNDMPQKMTYIQQFLNPTVSICFHLSVWPEGEDHISWYKEGLLGVLHWLLGQNQRSQWWDPLCQIHPWGRKFTHSKACFIIVFALYSELLIC